MLIIILAIFFYISGSPVNSFLFTWEPFHLVGMNTILTHYLLVWSTDNICIRFRSRSGTTKCRAWSGAKLFDTLMVFLKYFFQNVWKRSAYDKKKYAKLPRRQWVKYTLISAWVKDQIFKIVNLRNSNFLTCRMPTKINNFMFQW